MFPFQASTASDSDLAFVANEEVALQAREDADGFVKMAKAVFGVTLDFSDASVEQVEQIAAEISAAFAAKTPKEGSIARLSYAIGGYVGETYRRNHTGVWGVMTQDGQQFSGMRTESGGLFWPTGKAEKRIRNGSEDNLWLYYQVLLKKESGA